MINKNLMYAVVGASNNKEKYGYKVFKDLLEGGYHVVAINPNEKEILGTTVSPTLLEYVGKIDVAIFVVPPHVTEKVLEEVKTLGIKNVRMQPGAESAQAISFCEKNGIVCTHDACIMLKNKHSKIKVLIGLSGGVDSAVAAYLLQKEGYDVTAGFMKNYVSETGNCTTYDDAAEAIKVAKFLGIKLLSFDLQKEYNEKIINYIYEGYKKGITPNPDVLCNSLIKFDVFLKKALEMGFDYIATGHYARIVHDAQVHKVGKSKVCKVQGPDDLTTGGPYRLLRGIDHNKDQSYFLSGLDQFQLSKSLFPLGKLEKPEVRRIAKEIGLPNAERKDSQGLCFVGNIPIRTFLEQKLPKKEGITIDESGKQIGKHEGARFFTIGQRQGLNLPPDRYVTKINVKKNIVTVGPRGSDFLNQKEINLCNRHWIGKTYTLPLNVEAKIRYRQIDPAPAMLTKGTSKNITAVFQEKQRAIAPGQVVVAYIGDECIGSGIIA